MVSGEFKQRKKQKRREQEKNLLTEHSFHGMTAEGKHGLQPV